MSIQSELRAYREHPREVERVERLFGLMARSGPQALDVGARDGHLSLLLAERFDHVVALDLNLPDITHPRVECVVGDAAQLRYADQSFHTVVCAEVLEHIPPALLPGVCRELVRVAAHHVVIGVPFRQDPRVACCTCRTCGTINPPWGHVNSFDLERLVGLMHGLVPVKVDFVGRTRAATNAVSAGLLRFAGNPYGTYDQHEPCIQCGQRLLPPAPRNLAQKVATRLAVWGNVVQTALTPWRGNWMHVLFEREPARGLAPQFSDRSATGKPLLRQSLATANRQGTGD
jgi:SAM-dependent methyltransferase